jgi:hypothetical protein
MKKIIMLFLVVLMASFVIGPSRATPVYSQGFATSWNSSFQVQNLEGVDATILVYYYDQSGVLAEVEAGFSNPQQDTVKVGQSNTYFPVHAKAGFNGSVVISSTRRVAVISNVFANTPRQAIGSYVGFEKGGPDVYFPLVMKNNNSQTSTFNVQNTGETDATVTISFIPEAGSTYPAISSIVAVIPKYTAKTYNLGTLSQFNGASKWVGSAVASVEDRTNDSVAGVVNNVKTSNTSAYELSTYNGFIGTGSKEVVLPLVQENNSSNRTAISCQNVGGGAADIKVTYTPEAGSVAKPDETKTGVPKNGLAVFIQNYNGTEKFVGSATATSGENMFCVVSQQKFGGAGRSSLYEGFSKATATGKVVLPLIQSRNGSSNTGWVYTAVTLATADGQSHPIRCDYKPGPGIATPPSQTGTGASVVLVQNDLFGNGTKFVGGAECTVTDGSGVGLFAVVNMLRDKPPALPRDTQSTYIGFNVTP